MLKRLGMHLMLRQVVHADRGEGAQADVQGGIGQACDPRRRAA